MQFDGGAFGNMPGLTVIRVPMALMQQIGPSEPEAIWSSSSRTAVMQRHESETDREHYSATLEVIRSWLTKQNREPIALLSIHHTWS